MAASMKILKYTGLGAVTEVSSLGFKRIDSTVAGSQDGAVDDQSDSIYYQIYTPQGTGITAASFEVWFRLAIDSPPDNQLSNIRLYVDGDAPEEGNAPAIKIGIAETYPEYPKKPTNAVSEIATTDIYSYGIDSPLAVTVEGKSGYIEGGDELKTYEYLVSIGDTGSGNVFYLNEVKQDTVTVGSGNLLESDNHVTYTFTNTSIYVSDDETLKFRLYVLDGEKYVDLDPSVYSIEVVSGVESIELDMTEFVSVYPNDALGNEVNQIIYMEEGEVDDGNVTGTETIGGNIEVLRTADDPIRESLEFIIDDADQGPFLLDGIRQPVLTFALNGTYTFINKRGSTDPFRLHSGGTSGASEENVIVRGVTVTDGGTDEEIVTVDASELFAFNDTSELVYQSTTNLDYGNRIDTYKTKSIDGCSPIVIYDGAYHMNEEGDTTDFIVMQVQVKEDTSPGDYMPAIKIIWDES